MLNILRPVHSQNFIRLRTMSLGIIVDPKAHARIGPSMAFCSADRLGERLDLLLEFIVPRHQFAVLQ
jgi:hypothetical protein